jgi:hypothetical protein
MSRSEFEHYRTAGELFGRVRAHLGFGDLSMRSDDHTVTFSWRVRSKGHGYAGDYAFSFEELVDQPEERLAQIVEHVTELWKHGARIALISR